MSYSHTKGHKQQSTELKCTCVCPSSRSTKIADSSEVDREKQRIGLHPSEASSEGRCDPRPRLAGPISTAPPDVADRQPHFGSAFLVYVAHRDHLLLGPRRPHPGK
ncbi:unnamed protein product [Pleuronectes platessa]|uniref:Uncharacterized protein n=1 Tax=Pleuronectes platessa TaxID=8262 RepID=A0A9N7Z647_PLEPL|nr:unnamed protein product [Pleuronectes platessa]